MTLSSQVSCIDPVEETRAYTQRMMDSKGPLSDGERQVLLEDLNSPCTEEIAVFDAFSALLAQTLDTLVSAHAQMSSHTTCRL